MTELDIAEQSYKNGYEKGQQDAVKWISVKDRLPERGSDILAYQDHLGNKRIVPANFDFDKWFDCCLCVNVEGITHWMPLPQPPKGAQGE